MGMLPKLHPSPTPSEYRMKVTKFSTVSQTWQFIVTQPLRMEGVDTAHTQLKFYV